MKYFNSVKIFQFRKYWCFRDCYDRGGNRLVWQIRNDFVKGKALYGYSLWFNSQYNYFYLWVTEPGESEEKKLQLSRGQWGHEIDCAILTVNCGVFKKIKKQHKKGGRWQNVLGRIFLVWLEEWGTCEEW